MKSTNLYQYFRSLQPKKSMVFRFFVINLIIISLVCVFTFAIVGNYTNFVKQEEKHNNNISTEFFFRFVSERFTSAHQAGSKANATLAKTGISDELLDIANSPQLAYSEKIVKEMLSFCSSVCSTDPYIADCIIVGDCGSTYVYSTDSVNHNAYMSYSYLEKEPFLTFYNSEQHEQFFYGGIPEYTSVGDTPVITYVCKIYNSKQPTLHETTGFIIINYDINKIKDYIDLSLSQFQGDLVVYYEKNDILFSTNENFYSIKPEELHEELGMDKVFLDVFDATSGLHVTGILSNDTISAKAIQMQTQQLLVFVVGISISLLISIAIFMYSHRRIRVLVEAISSANLSERLPVKSDDEIGLICTAFNKKNEQLEAWIDRHYTMQLQLRTAELNALTAQINPHFLYNTLEGIRMKAMISGNNDIAEASSLLGHMFRWMLSSSKMAVQIADELEYINAYLSLQTIRSPDHYSYDIRVPQSLHVFGIPKLVLQPLIENAIIHGSKGVENLHIAVTAQRDGGDIAICIEDNGSGIEEKYLYELKQSLGEAPFSTEDKSIGCKNVHQRIHLLFGESYGLDIKSEKGKGTTVVLRIPCMSVQQMNKLQDLEQEQA